MTGTTPGTEARHTSLSEARLFAWANVAAGFVLWCLLVVGPSVIMPILYGAIGDDMGWSRGEVVFFSSTKFAVGAAICLFAGYAFDFFGLKRLLVFAGLLGGAGIALAGVSRSLPLYYFAGGIVGVSALTAVVGVKVLISRWFSARFGFALGVALLGGALAGVVLPFLTEALAQEFGWRVAGVSLGIGISLLSSTGALVLIRDTPRALGWTGAEIDPVGGRAGAAPSIPPGAEFSKVRRSREFWLVMMLCFLVGGIDHAIHEHTPLLLERDANLGRYGAAAGLSSIVVIGGFGKIAFGWLFDRTSTKGIAVCWLLMSLTLLLALNLTVPALILLFTTMRGISHGGVLIDLPVLAKHCFGVRSVAKTIAFLSAASTFGGSVVSGLVGFVHDLSGSYGPSFIVLAALSFACAVVVWMIAPTYWARGAALGERQATTAPVRVP